MARASRAISRCAAPEIPLERLSPGNHTLRIDAYRGLGERRVLEQRIEILDAQPLLHVDEAPAGVAYGLLHAAGRVEGQARVLWRIDHDVWQELPPGAEWSLSEPTLGIPGGAHTIAFKAVALDAPAESLLVEYPFRLVKLEPDAPPTRPETTEEARSVAMGPLTALGAIVLAAVGRFAFPRRR
jgi:hypothetical protein